MNPQQDALSIAFEKLNTCGLPYMVTGSCAGLFYGRQRTTEDIDVVLDCRRINPGQLSRHFAPEYFLDPEMIRNSLPQRLMFNAIALFGGPKVDLIPLRNEPFELQAFERRARLPWHDTTAWVIDVTDLAISKLIWAKRSGSERQIADVRAILARGEQIDEQRLTRWVRALGLSEVLDASRSCRYDA